MKIVVDSYAWIEIFSGNKIGAKAVDIMAEAGEVYTPSIVLAEVARKYIKENFKMEDVKARLEIIEDSSTLADIDTDVALASAEAYIELKDLSTRRGLSRPSLFDAIILAITRLQGAKILTGDEHFKELPETIWMRENE